TKLHLSAAARRPAPPPAFPRPCSSCYPCQQTTPPPVRRGPSAHVFFRERPDEAAGRVLPGGRRPGQRDMKNDFIIAIAQLSAEKNLDSTTVFEAVEAAMASAFKKDELQYADIEVKIDVQDGDIEAWRRYLVMPDDEIEDDEIQVSPERARAMGFASAQV